MLKHPDLTLRRIDQFLETYRRSLVGESHALKIEKNMAPTAPASQKEAEKGPWQEVGPGFAYGPAYTVHWFRITGTVPAHLAGKPLHLIAEVGGERTVWKDNSPWCGLDVEHSDMGWLSGSGIAGQREAKAGEKVEYVIQAHARNAQTRVHGREPERTPTTETVDRAELVVIDPDAKDLGYDLEFSRLLLKTLPQDDPSYATLLRALNEVANIFASGAHDARQRSKTIVKTALGSLNGEFKHTIYPVGHAHLDTAWLWPLAVTKLKMAHTTATQLGLLEKYPEYVFVHSQASQYEWLEKEYPKLFQRVKAAVARGQWEPVGSMWVEADCNLTGAESLVRQFLYGRRYFREKLGYETHDMWLPDVFGYSAALPQILHKFNIRYFLTQKISWNQINKFPHHTFWWQGIDGTRVWTHFPPADTYNASCEPAEVVFSVKNYKDHGRADQSLYVFGFGDGGGGPTERHLELLRRGRLAPHYPEVATGKRAIDFFREARARSRDLMTWVGELYLELHRGTYTSQAANKKGNRVSEFLLRDAELLACFDPAFPKSYPGKELEAAWKLVLLNQFHDIIPGSSVREVYEDSDKDYAEIARVGEEVIRKSLVSIGGKLDTSTMQRPVALFQNASMATEASIPWPHESVPASLAVDGEVLPVQLVEGLDERKIIFATPAAASGTVAIGDLGDAAPTVRYRLKGSNRRLENSELAVRFDANGNIASIQSLEDGTEFVQPGKIANLFQLLDDKPLFWSAWDVDVYSFETAKNLLKSESFEIVERGPVRVAAEVVKRFGNSTIRQRISLGPTPGIRFDTVVDWHEEDKMLKVAFPANLNANRVTCEIQFGHVERPTHVNTSWDLAKFEICAQKWIDMSEGDQGLALLNDSKYGHDVRGNVMRLSLLRSPKAPDPQCDMGRHRFTYVLMPHFGALQHAGVVQAAYSLNAPLRSALLEPKTGVSGTLPAFVGCDDRNMVIESVKKAEDSNDLIVRLYECHNSRGRSHLYCARPVKAAYVCDLEEKETGELEIVGDRIPFAYKPFEIITLKLRV